MRRGVAVMICVLLCTVLAQQQQDGDVFAEFHMNLAVSNPNWPQPNFASCGEFLAMLAQAANGINALTLDNSSCTLLFTTVVVTIFGNSGTNAASVAQSLVQQINAPSSVMGPVLTRGQIAGANYTNAPVPIPTIYHAPTNLDNTFLVALGAGGVVLMVAQFAYGLYHFKGFDFITAGKDERA